MRFDASDAHKAIRQFKARYPKAVTRALNRAAGTARAAVASAISKETGLKVGDVKRKLKVFPASEGKPTARVSSLGRPMPLVRFPHRGPKPSRGRGRGVVAMRGRVQYPNAFIATVRGRYEGIWHRSGKARFPIQQVYGPSMPELFERHIPLGRARGLDSLRKNLARELRFAFSFEGR